MQASADLGPAIGAARATPMDAVNLDLGPTGCQHVEAVTRIHAAFPEVVIIGVSFNNDPQVIADAHAAGSNGYLPKGLTTAGLTKALIDTWLSQKPDCLVPEFA